MPAPDKTTTPDESTAAVEPPGSTMTEVDRKDGAPGGNLEDTADAAEFEESALPTIMDGTATALGSIDLDSRSGRSSRSLSRSSSTGPRPGVKHLQPGTRLGRYLVVECIGEGAMGQVYAAYDPELDRKIALKLMQAGKEGSSKDSSSSSSPGRRLLREAKALSQLAHPNVVSVFDVGTLGNEVFVAMEFVAGTDLRKWAQEKQRPWREILDAYLQAGRGLAAAHAAGLVHRDFKPHNAILGADGRVRVLDFGLAAPRSAHALEGAASQVMDQLLVHQGSHSDSWERFTQTGSVLGTPAYMAPEVIQGKGADEKSDQFSFAASLFQALYGCLPFHGKTLRELDEAIRIGRVADTHGIHVPGWLKRAVLQGLAADPLRRHASMVAMLTVLERKDPASVRQRWMLRSTAAVTVIAAVGLGMLTLANHSVRKCQGAEQQWKGIWDSTTQEAVQKALVATGLSYAPDTWKRVQTGLGNYTSGWVAMHTDACLATHVRGDQSGEMLDLRMRCLKDRQAEVKALVEVLAHADKEVVAKAVPAVGSLVPLSTCADVESLRVAVPPPKDPSVRQQVEVLKEQLEHARALERTGKYADGMDLVQSLEPSVVAIDYKPLLAEVLLLKGLLLVGRGRYAEAITELEQTDREAARSRHALVSALAERELVYVVGFFLQRFDEGLVRAHYAEINLIKSGLFDQQGDRLLSAIGMVYARKGQPAKAVEYQQRALPLCSKLTSVEECHAITLNLGNAFYAAGKLEDGEKHMRQAIADMQKHLGPTHPELGRAMNNYGLLLTDAGKYEDAQQWLEKALAAWDASLDKDHPLVATALNNLGNVHWFKGRYDDALTSHQKALQIRLKALGPEHPEVATSYQNLGISYEGKGNLALAREHYQRCMDLRSKTLGAEHNQTLWCLNNMACTLVVEKKYDAAQADFEKIVTIWSKTLGPEHPNLSEPLLNLAEIAVSRRDPTSARPLLERALRILEVNKIESARVATARLDLARLLWPSPATRQRAIAQAHAAADLAARLPGNQDTLRKDITAWLEQHRL